MGIPHDTVIQIQNEGISMVDDLADFDKDSLSQLLDNLRKQEVESLTQTPTLLQVQRFLCQHLPSEPNHKRGLWLFVISSNTTIW